MQLRLLNLPRTSTELDITALFSEFGDVVSCQIIKDNQTGASKGFGFIEMADEEAAHKAIDAFHKKKVKGSRIRVKMVS
jgi:RNA recognition motif-containing protein